ncbi:MAG: YbjN domain-containing protein [Chloroflexi bacterium]|nr:YbjN domain-containing protein [Chloroflexota bacterium]MBU1751257.1 YbjN domain-containing protein [Chloroflexota bacterium]
MEDDGNGRNGTEKRIHDLDAVRPFGVRAQPLDLTPDEARALIDGVFRSYGLDPRKSTDPYGWRRLSLGSADGLVGIVEWQPDEYYLVVVAPLLELPTDPEPPADFYRLLLALNHDGTFAARFSIHDNVVHVGLARPIRGLVEEEVDDAIRAVMVVADSYDEWLQIILDTARGLAPLPLSELPSIKMTPKEAQGIGAVLAACDPHGRDIFRYLMEHWQKAGYVVEPGTSGIGLKITIGSKSYGLAGMRPGVGERRQLVILGWEGLHQTRLFPVKALERFQSTVAKIATLRVTESTAHIEVTAAFDRGSAKALLNALRALAKTAHEPRPEPRVEWESSLPQMNITVGTKTLAGIRKTLLACEPRTQQIYALLIAGWNQEGGTVQCNRPGRIYLKFKTGEHEFGEYGRRTHQFNLAVLAAPKGKENAAIDVAWNLATGDYAYLAHLPDEVARFEALVSGLPGFGQRGAVTRLVVDEPFQAEHARALLQAMLDLKSAEGESPPTSSANEPVP